MGEKKIQITNIRTKRGDITTDRTHITRTTKECYKQLYHTNSITFMRWTNSLKTTNYQKSPKLNLGGIEVSISGDSPGFIQDHCLLPVCCFSSLRLSSHLHNSSYHQSLVLNLGHCFISPPFLL